MSCMSTKHCMSYHAPALHLQVMNHACVKAKTWIQALPFAEAGTHIACRQARTSSTEWCLATRTNPSRCTVPIFQTVTNAEAATLNFDFFPLPASLQCVASH